MTLHCLALGVIVTDVDLDALHLLTVPEVAKRLRLSVAYVYKLLRPGPDGEPPELESVQIGRSRRVHPRQLAAYLDRVSRKDPAPASTTDAA